MLREQLTEKGRIRNWAVKISLLFLSSLFALTTAELALRLCFFKSFSLPKTEAGLRRPHPVLGWSLSPDASILVHKPDYTVEVKTNSKGFRDVEHEYRPVPGVFRILVLGDSFMEAYQVELEESLPRRLERALAGRGVEVVNMGVGGYGTAQEFLLLREEGVKFEPDLVVLAFLQTNDVRNNSQELEKALWKEEGIKTFGRPYARADAAEEKLVFTPPDFERSKQWAETMGRAEKSYLLRTAIVLGFLRLKSAVTPQSRPSYDPNILYGPFLTKFDPPSGLDLFSHAEYRRMWDEGRHITERIIVHARDFTEALGAGFVLLVVPSKVQAVGSYRAAVIESCPGLELDFAEPGRKLAASAADHGISVLDLSPAFRAADREGARLYHELDRHWNAQGHELAALELATYLEERGLVPPPSEPAEDDMQ